MGTQKETLHVVEGNLVKFWPISNLKINPLVQKFHILLMWRNNKNICNSSLFYSKKYAKVANCERKVDKVIYFAPKRVYKTCALVFIRKVP